MDHDHHPSGIHILSPEILLQIFALVVQGNAYEYASEQQQWDAICQTCASWRTLALSAPALWTHIVDAPAPWTQILIQRSQSSPLTVSFVISDPTHWSSCTLALEKSHRISFLSVQFRLVDSWWYMQSLADSLKQPLPCLQHCNLDVHVDGQQEPIICISLDAPHLSSFYLRNVDLTPSLLRVSTSLRDFSHFSSVFIYSPDDLLARLVTMPMLHSLHLCLPGHTSRRGDAESEPVRVRLENLARIKLHGPFGWISSFLSSLVFPITADLDVFTSYQLDHETATFGSFLRSLIPRFELLAQKKETFLTFDCADSCLSIRFNINPTSRRNSTFHLRIERGTKQKWKEFLSEPSFIAFMTSLSDLTALKLRVVSASFNELTDSTYDVLLHYFTQIQELHLEMPGPMIGGRRFSIYYPLSFTMRDFTAMPGWYDGKVLPSLKRLVLWTSSVDEDLLNSILRTFTRRNLERIDISCEDSLSEEWKQRLDACLRQ